MNIVIQKSCEAVGRERWSSLLSRSVTNTIFQTYAWHRAFEAAYSGGHAGYILCGMDGDDLAGIAPFCLCRSRGENVIRFLGYERADYCDLIFPELKKEFVAEVFSFLKNRSSEWDRIELANIPEQSPTPALIFAACKELRLISCRGNRTPCPALVFNDKDRSVDEQMGKKSLVRHHRYFSKKPDFHVSHFINTEEIAPRLPAFFDQHIARWSTTGFPSLFLDAAHREFYAKLTGELGAGGGLLFTEVYADGRPIAFHFGFAYNRRLLWYKPSFDILLAGFSPGEALLRELMTFARKNGLDELDFTIGDEPFKRRFSNVVRHNVSLHIFRRPSRLISFRMRRLIKRVLNGLPPGFMDRALSAADLIRTKGYWGMMQKTMAALSGFFYRRESVIVYSRREAEPGDLEKDAGQETYRACPGTLDDAIRFYGYMSEKEKHHAVGNAVRRLRDGDTLFVATQGAHIAGIAWVSVAAPMNIKEIGYRLELPPGSIALTAGVGWGQLPESRIFRLLLNSISGKFPGKAQIICCEENNNTLRRVIEDLFTGDWIIRMVSICGLRFHSVKPFRLELPPRV